MQVGHMILLLPYSQILVLLSPCLMRRSACTYPRTFYFTPALPAHLHRSLNNLHTFPCCKHIARCPPCAFNVLHTIKCQPLVPALCVSLRIDRRLHISGDAARSSTHKLCRGEAKLRTAYCGVLNIRACRNFRTSFP